MHIGPLVYALLFIAFAAITTACSTPIAKTDTESGSTQEAHPPNLLPKQSNRTESAEEAVAPLRPSVPSVRKAAYSRSSGGWGLAAGTDPQFMTSGDPSTALDVAVSGDGAFRSDFASNETVGKPGQRERTADGARESNKYGLRLAQASDAPGTQAASSSTAGNADATNLAKMAQKANNPLSDVWLLLTQNDTTIIEGDLVDDKRTLNSLKVQPVMPVPVFDQKWNLIFRPVLQFISSPLDDDVGDLFGVNQGQIAADDDLRRTVQDPYGRTNGLGDSVLLTLLGPNRDDGFVWGGGVTQIFPTATEDVLGQGKWQAGPTALALRLGKDSGGLGIENWNVGFLAQQWWSYAGDSDRSSTNQTDIQYFINWKMNSTQLIGMTPNIRINWRADGDEKLSFPIGLGTIGMFKIGRLPVRWGIEVQRYVVQPDDVAAEWNFKLFFAPIILNPFK